MKLRTSILPAFFMEPVKNYFKFKRLHLNLITNALFYNLLKFFSVLLYPKTLQFSVRIKL